MFRSFSLEIINSLSPLELELLRYINRHKKEITEMSIHQLAQNAFVSTATVNRLCKKLDLDGYSHLKYFLRTKLSAQSQPTNFYGSYSLHELLQEDVSDIERTAREMNLSSVQEIAGLMHRNTQIHFFAEGLNSLVFEYAYRTLLSLSRYAVQYQDAYIAYIQAESFTENDIIFLASLSGEQQSVIRVAQIARSKNAKVVTFTAKPISTLAKIGTYPFILVNDATTTLDIDTKSRCQLMLILNTIIKSFIQQGDYNLREKGQ